MGFARVNKHRGLNKQTVTQNGAGSVRVDLFDGHGMYRRDDPDTSRDAAVTAAGTVRARHQALIVSVLKSVGRPLAAEEIADRGGFESHVPVNRRLPELVRDGLVERTDEKHRNRSGSEAYRYRALVPAAVG